MVSYISYLLYSVLKCQYAGHSWAMLPKTLSKWLARNNIKSCIERKRLSCRDAVELTFRIRLSRFVIPDMQKTLAAEKKAASELSSLHPPRAPFLRRDQLSVLEDELQAQMRLLFCFKNYWMLMFSSAVYGGPNPGLVKSYQIYQWACSRATVHHSLFPREPCVCLARV